MSGVNLINRHFTVRFFSHQKTIVHLVLANQFHHSITVLKQLFLINLYEKWNGEKR